MNPYKEKTIRTDVSPFTGRKTYHDLNTGARVRLQTEVKIGGQVNHYVINSNGKKVWL